MLNIKGKSPENIFSSTEAERLREGRPAPLASTARAAAGTRVPQGYVRRGVIR